MLFLMIFVEFISLIFLVVVKSQSFCDCGLEDFGSGCQPCSEGYYKDTGSTDFCSLCPAGYFCQGTGTCNPSECLPGKYSLGGASSCTCCTNGFVPNAQHSNCNPCNAPGTYSQCHDQCETCPAGSYAGVAHNMCLNCEKGYYCQGGISTQCPYPRSSDPAASSVNDCYCCPKGKEINFDQSYCLSCGTGKVSDTLCEACYTCPAGKYANPPKTICANCDAGFYCDGSGIAKQCPSGRVVDYGGATSAGECTCCTDGKIPRAGNDLCVDCPSGRIKTGCGSVCSICTSGSYASSDHTQCLQCNIGHYCVNGLKSQCVPQQRAVAGSSMCSCCDVGWEPDSIQQFCDVCPDGYVTDGACTLCRVCQEGTYSNFAHTQCETCPVGEYCTSGMRFNCQDFEYSPSGSSRVEDCQCCEAGSFLLLDQSGCDACPAGHVSSECETFCSVCGEGWYASDGAEDCGECEVGFWCSGGLKTRCGDGYTSPKGSSDINQCECCPVGSFEMSGECYTCPMGSYQDFTCSTACKPCGEGQTSVQPTFTSCQDCTAGSYCTAGSEIPCTPGSYSLPGASSPDDCLCCGDGEGVKDSKDGCELCPAGKFATTCSDCRDCPPGSVAETPGRSVCDECQPGSFQQAGEHSKCFPCAENAITNTAGQTECRVCEGTKTPNVAHDDCVDCAEGYYCFQGEQLLCPAGFYCQSGVDIRCAAGTYTKEGVNTECLECLSGHICPNGELEECPPSTWCPPGSSTWEDCGCLGHGACENGPLSEGGDCQCFSGYTLADCSSFACWQFHHEDSLACSGFGWCAGHNECKCFPGYVGNECQEWHCYGIHYTNDSVCSGHGKCIDADSCKCSGTWKLAANCSISKNPHKTSSTSRLLAMTLLPALAVGGGVLLLVVLCAIIAIALYACRRQRKELEKYENISGILLAENEVEMRGMEDKLSKLKINEDMFKIDFSEIQTLQKIAAGVGGSVFKAMWRDILVAFKLFHMRSMMDETSFKEFETEVNLLASVHHPYIVEFYGASMKPPRVGIIMKFAENGNLEQFLKSYQKENNEEYPFSERIRFLKEIASAMNYLHSKSIIHRDLKTHNVVIEKSMECKVMDFGCARYLHKSGDGERRDQSMTMMIGTSVFMSPELVVGDSKTYTEAVDVFSFSIIAWILASYCFTPYGEKTFGIERKVAGMHLRPKMEEISESIPAWIKEMIVCSWDEKPEKRPSFAEIEKLIDRNLKKIQKPSDGGGRGRMKAPPPPVPKRKPEVYS